METRRRLGWIAAAVLAAGLASPAWADEPSGSSKSHMLRKLGRGIANVATCPLELIRTPTLVGREDGVCAQLTVGIVQGVVRTIARGMAGAYEIFSFYAPAPNHYGPIMKPEFVWAHGNWTEDEE